MAIDVSGTPGKAAFLKFMEVTELPFVPWEDIDPPAQAKWEQIAEAAIVCDSALAARNTGHICKEYCPEHD